MIITITGKPCTGKSTLAEIFENKYNFERICAGQIFKKEAKNLGIDILDFIKSKDIYKIDEKVDNYLKQIYNTRLNDDIIIESRTSWSFMPEAFNVFVDLPEEIMADRLFNSDRHESEKGISIHHAKQKVSERYKSDVERYKKLYNIDCDDLSNYDFVIDNSNLTPEQTADEIYKAYKNFIKQK